MEDILKRINKIKSDIYKFTNINENDRYEQIPNINSQITIINTLLELEKISDIEMHKYNEACLNYAKLLKNDKFFISKDKNIRLQRIEKDTQNIIQMQELIDEFIDTQSEKIDKIEINMTGCEENMKQTIKEMYETKAKAYKKMRLWRYLIFISLFSFLFIIYKII